LEDIYYYTFLNCGELQADKYLSELKKTFEMLSVFPNLGRKYNIEENILIYTYKSNNIVYLVNLKEIVILRILHYRQDLEVELSNKLIET
jgi:toxin ParE1/3/4